MKQLIEFKLHAGNIPYFVHDIIGGVDISGKKYGISEDTETCYLPNTVYIFTENQFIDIVVSADIHVSDYGESTRLMSAKEKEDFCIQWLDKHK